MNSRIPTFFWLIKGVVLLASIGFLGISRCEAFYVCCEPSRSVSNGVELIILPKIAPNPENPFNPGDPSCTAFEMLPGDEVQLRIFLRNVSGKPVRLITAPEFGFRNFGDQLKFSADPEYLDGTLLRVAESRLDIVELGPNEIVSLGEAKFSSEGRERWSGELLVSYSIDEKVARQHSAWAGAIYCRIQFPFRSLRAKEGPTLQAVPKRADQAK